MKKTFSILALFLSTLVSAQFTPTGTSLTDNKYRSGGLALGYSNLLPPTFGTNKFMVNGNQFLTGRIEIGNTINVDDATSNWGIKSKKPPLPRESPRSPLPRESLRPRSRANPFAWFYNLKY